MSRIPSCIACFSYWCSSVQAVTGVVPSTDSSKKPTAFSDEQLAAAAAAVDCSNRKEPEQVIYLFRRRKTEGIGGA